MKRLPYRIAVDARPLSTPMSGVGRVISNVIRRFPQSERFVFELYSHSPFHSDFTDLLRLPNVVWIQGRGATARWGGLWFNLTLPRLIRSSKTDLFWGSQQVIPPGLPRDLPVVLTYYDLVLYLFPDAMRLPARVQQRMVQPMSVRRADRILSISKQTQDDMIARFGYPESQARVALLGYDIPARKAPTKSSAVELGTATRAALDAAPFMLSVSTIEPRKNYDTLLRAYLEYHDRTRQAGATPYALVIVGRRGWETSEFYAELERAQARAPIHVVDDAGDAELQELYRQCAFFCMPSRYEGFGLTLLEALAHGCYAVASDLGCLREIGGDRIEYVPAEDVGAWAERMGHVARQHKQGRLPKIRFPTKEWSWDRTAVVHWEAFVELLEPG